MSKPRADPHGFKWECWGQHHGKRCGRMCGGHQPCTRCGREAPRAAWSIKYAAVRGPTPPRRRQRSASRKVERKDESAEMARLHKENLKHQKEKKELEEALASRTCEASASPENEDDDPKTAMRQKLAVLREHVAKLEDLQGTMPELPAIHAAKKIRCKDEISARHWWCWLQCCWG